MAVIWAVLWAPLGAALLVSAKGSNYVPSPPWSAVLEHALRGARVGAVWGLLSGAVFAATLAAVERRGGIERLLSGRVVAWGALSGMAFPAIMVLRLGVYGPDHDAIARLLTIFGLSALYGAAVAGGLLAAARRGMAPGV